MRGRQDVFCNAKTEKMRVELYERTQGDQKNIYSAVAWKKLHTHMQKVFPFYILLWKQTAFSFQRVSVYCYATKISSKGT